MLKSKQKIIDSNWIEYLIFSHKMIVKQHSVTFFIFNFLKFA